MPELAGRSVKEEPRKLPLPSQQPRLEGYHLSWLKIPAPIKRIFDKFPIVTYEHNELPQGRSKSREEHVLYTFTTAEAAKAGKPSYNPTCLKWQVRVLPNHSEFR